MADERIDHGGDGGVEAHDPAAPLFGAARLSPDEASRLLARGPGRLVVWAGEPGAGKTSLSVQLYERQRHAGSEARFAGSWTLLAFEQLAHAGRIAGNAPATGWPRRSEADTAAGELLHLALSAGEDPLHLLFAELPGEILRRVADNQVPASEVPWLRRADKLALIVDGDRLIDPVTRAMVLTRVRQLTERLRSSELPHPGSGLALLVTKWDRVRADAAAVAYWEPREAELLAELGALDQGARALRIAAGSFEPHHDDGFAALRAWLLGAPAPIRELPLEMPLPMEIDDRLLAFEDAAGPPEARPSPAPPVPLEDTDDEPLLELPVEGFGWLKEPPARLRIPWRPRR